MIRSFGVASALLAILPFGIVYAASSAASPPGGDGQCTIVLEAPTVVQLSGVNYVRAAVHPGACTLHTHIINIVCLSVAGSDSAGQCIRENDPNTAVVYAPYRSGATYVATGQGCGNLLQGSATPDTPKMVCLDAPTSRATL